MKTEPSVKPIKKGRKAPEPQAQAKSAAGPNRWSKAVQSWVREFHQHLYTFTYSNHSSYFDVQSLCSTSIGGQTRWIG